jgi:hypothetical protein
MIDRSKSNSKNFGNRYDWNKIQEYYDTGNSWRNVIDEFGVSSAALQKAKKRGDFKTRTRTEASKISLAKYGPPRMGPEARKRLSIAQSTNNRGGKSKWYLVSNQLVQGTWERDLAIKMNLLNIKWNKLKTGKDVWPYVIDGNIRNYTPDFYLEEFDVYLDPKGYWWGNDKHKIEEVRRQHSNKRLIIIETPLYKTLLKADYTEFVTLLT